MKYKGNKFKQPITITQYIQCLICTQYLLFGPSYVQFSDIYLIKQMPILQKVMCLSTNTNLKLI